MDKGISAATILPLVGLFNAASISILLRKTGGGRGLAKICYNLTKANFGGEGEI